MSRESDFAEFPERVGAGTERAGAYYERAPGLYAVRGADRESADAAGAEVFFEEEGVAVFRGEPGGSPGAEAGRAPVYRLHPDGPLAVPTGDIFVRFREGVEAATRREEIERAGYELVSVPPYATHCAWVRSASGDVARSLSGVGALEVLPDVANVEPQMLVERSLR